MKRGVHFSLLAGIAIALLLPVGAFAEAPHEIAGFVLQADISQYKDKIETKTPLPVRDAEYLTEVDVAGSPGFKSGQLTYGNCAHPGRVVKISMKYLNSDRDFFEKLLARFKEKYGEPVEWRGDPFHVYVAWKWSFLDKDNKRVSMILQHYSGDEDVYKSGNSVKLSMFDLIEEEEKCYVQKHAATAAKETPKGESKKQTDIDFDQLIPRP